MSRGHFIYDDITFYLELILMQEYNKTTRMCTHVGEKEAASLFFYFTCQPKVSKLSQSQRYA